MRIPLIVGANSADAGGFVAGATKDEVFSLYGARKAEAIATYDPNGTIDLRALITVAARDRVHLEPARMTARAFTENGSPVYAFRFSYVQSARRQRSPDGAAHASEIPFVFDTAWRRRRGRLRAGAGGDGRGPQGRPDDSCLLGQLCQDRRPERSGLTSWPRYDVQKDVIFDFRADATEAAVADPWKARLDLVEHLSNTTPVR